VKAALNDFFLFFKKRDKLFMSEAITCYIAIFNSEKRILIIERTYLEVFALTTFIFEMSIFCPAIWANNYISAVPPVPPTTRTH
jgi:hypothetical protein